MGMGVRPRGAGVFGTFLNAQETSPTLILAHAGIGDDGAQEIAHHVAVSPCLLRLDLSGCGITSVGAVRLAAALKQNRTLESLVLRHNAIGATGDAGLQALCRALRGHETLKHLDLRRNSLPGAPAAACLGEMLQANSMLTHLELSWNQLDASGGQVLLEHMRANTTLLDCQLTGCGLAEETLVGIAEMLHRNRTVAGATLEPGPYQAAKAAGPALATRDAQDALGVSLPRLRSPAAGCAGPLEGSLAPTQIASPDLDAHSPCESAVTAERTREMIERLLEWRARTQLHDLSKSNGPNQAGPNVQAYLECLDQAQAALEHEREEWQKVYQRTELLLQGHQDRALRYRSSMADAQDKLLQYSKENRDLHGILERFTADLGILREAYEEAQRDLRTTQRRSEAEETEATAGLATLSRDRETSAKRLAELTEMSERQECLNKELRVRVEKVRAGVVMAGTGART